jgi:hypothetical protein
MESEKVSNVKQWMRRVAVEDSLHYFICNLLTVVTHALIGCFTASCEKFAVA